MQEKLATDPEVITSGETALLYDVATLINAVYQMTIEPTRESNIPKRIVKKIRPLLKGQQRITYKGDDAYIDMLMHVLKTLKLIKYTQAPFDNAKPYLSPGPRLEGWANKDMIEQTSQLLDEWQHNHNWADNPRVSTDGGSWNYYGAYELTLRQLLLTHLREYPEGSWHSVAALISEIWDAHPELATQQKMRPYSYGYYQMPKKQAKRDLFQEWVINAAPHFINMLYSSLNELGIVDMGNAPLQEETKLVLKSCAFRITELGAQVLAYKKTKAKSGKSEVAPAQKSLIIQPNYEILLLQPDLPTLYSILPFTQVKQIQMVSTLLLTQDALLRAIQQGLRIETILAILRERSQKELPQNVIYTLQDWAKQYKHATVSQVALLELPDEETTTRLSQHPTLSKMNARQLMPTTLAIPTDTNGNINYQSIRQVLEKEHISVDFQIHSSDPMHKLREYYYDD
ncbi:helicase-associated domain-containing protein [Dictyobacter kobayashii]|uniref:Helicase XPB/Ssl2 N-terminal domain-containing protein n=1 Tax=Dictyobacter kobayashii TaxID=2014872 RepID=A0A402AJ79_9CHLR|nr:helicase-associated domain-containing protein [Dictyobacter kobayashii]GCE19123.1 hypothetical protein KDK_29230 [Dictyobacter kobayashii]